MAPRAGKMLQGRGGSLTSPVDLRHHFLNPLTHTASLAKGSQRPFQCLLKQLQRHPSVCRVEEHVMVGRVLVSSEGAMAWTNLPPYMERPSSQAGGQGPICVTPHIPFKCSSHRTPSSRLSNAEGGPGGRVLGCTTSPTRLSRVYEVQKHPSLTSCLWDGPQQRNSSAVLKLGQGNEYTATAPHIQVYRSESATCKVLGSKLSHPALKSHNGACPHEIDHQEPHTDISLTQQLANSWREGQRLPRLNSK